MMNGFGEAGLVAGLIFAHFKATGKQVPLDWVRTDTCTTDGCRLCLRFYTDTGLHCWNWDFDGQAHGLFGVFALGVEVLG